MERTYMSICKQVVSWMVLVAATLWVTAQTASAGVVLAPPQPPAEMPGPDDNYEESAFGQTPKKPLGRMSGRAAEDLDRDPQYQQRGPASVNQSADLSGGDRSDRGSRGLEPLTKLRRGIQEISIIAGDLGFFPKVVFATRDVPVRFYVTGASKNTLCMMMDSFQVRRQVRSAKIEEITFTPGTAGKYRFYCPVNGMEGTLVVRDLASYEQAEVGAQPEQQERVKAVQSAPKRKIASQENDSEE